MESIPFRLLTYNTMLLVPAPLRYNGCEERSVRIAHEVYNNIAEVDVICLQEVVKNAKSVVNSFSRHPYRTRPMRSSIFSSKIRFWPSGLFVVSSHPIVEERQLVFTGPGYHADKYASKGLVYVKLYVEKMGSFVHVINVHLNAWYTPEACAARSSQVQQVSQFIEKMDIKGDEPLFVAGDFNIDLHTHRSECEEVASQLGCEIVPFDKVDFSVNPSINKFVGTDAPEQYTSHLKDSECYQSIIEGRGCPCCSMELLDMAMIRKGFYTFNSAKAGVVRLRSSFPFHANKNVFTKDVGYELSDHFPVLVETSWTPQDATSTREEYHRCTTRRVVVDGEFSWHFFGVFLCVVIPFFLILYYILSSIFPKKRGLLWLRKQY